MGADERERRGFFAMKIMRGLKAREEQEVSSVGCEGPGVGGIFLSIADHNPIRNIHLYLLNAGK